MRSQQTRTSETESSSLLQASQHIGLYEVVPGICIHYHLLSLFLDFIYLFLEKGREEERERNINVWLLIEHPLLGTWPAT